MFDKYISFIPLIMAGFSIAALVTPFIIKLALKWGVYDKPKDLIGKDDKVIETNLHNKIMPRMGFVAVLLPIFIVTPFFVQIGIREIVIALTLVILTILGILDDKYRLPAGPQLLVQVFCILIVIICGVTIQNANNPFSDSFINFNRANISFMIGSYTIGISLVSAAITFIWMLFISNF